MPLRHHARCPRSTTMKMMNCRGAAATLSCAKSAQSLSYMYPLTPGSPRYLTPYSSLPVQVWSLKLAPSEEASSQQKKDKVARVQDW